MDRNDASTVAKLLDLLVRFNLPVKNCRGQCYDGAANMARQRAGVATKIKEVELRALYIIVQKRRVCFFRLNLNWLLAVQALMHWTVRAESLHSVLSNYAVIQSVLEEGKCRGHCFCARGTYCDGKISFLFAVTPSEKIFSLTDRLSRALQAKHFFAVEAKKYVAVTMACLKELRNE